MQNKPQYAITSVDHALHLVLLLHQEGTLRLVDAADRLNVSRSTAHRLLAMLVYRGFAEQSPDKSYRPGTALRSTPLTDVPVAALRKAALPVMTTLMHHLGETVNLIIRTARTARFITTVESPHILRVGDRSGRDLPAHLTSGGKALLAHLPPQDLTNLYTQPDADPIDLTKLRRELSLTRKQGFALNNQLTEVGLTAIGVAIPTPPPSPSPPWP